MTSPRRLCAVLLAVLASGALSACGKHQSTGPIRIAETEGIYLDVSDLKYQVQVSRQLNPHDVQDKPYLTGLPEAERDLKPDEVWFAVTLRVQNETDEALRPSEHIEIEDTQENTFEPVELEDSNVYAYRANEAIPPRQVYPLDDSPGFDTPGRGALLLFRLTLDALNNRPLEFTIKGRKPPIHTGIVDLDV